MFDIKYSVESVHSRNWQDLRKENTGEAMYNIGRHQRRELHLHNRILLRRKKGEMHNLGQMPHTTYICVSKWTMPVFVPQSQQTHQTPSAKPVHREDPHNRFSCPAKSTTFSHRGPDYHQCMNGVAFGVTYVPLWRCTCEEGNCMKLQTRAGSIFLSLDKLQRQPNCSLDNRRLLHQEPGAGFEDNNLLFSASDGPSLFNFWHILHTKLESPFELIISQKARLLINIEKENYLPNQSHMMQPTFKHSKKQQKKTKQS